MYKNKNIILFAFASLDLKKSVERLKEQALNQSTMMISKLLHQMILIMIQNVNSKI